MKKNLPFHDALYHLTFLYFSTARQAKFIRYIEKGDSGEQGSSNLLVVKDLKTAQPMRDQSWTKVMEKLS